MSFPHLDSRENIFGPLKCEKQIVKVEFKVAAKDFGNAESV